MPDNEPQKNLRTMLTIVLSITTGLIAVVGAGLGMMYSGIREDIDINVIEDYVQGERITRNEANITNVASTLQRIEKKVDTIDSYFRK